MAIYPTYVFAGCIVSIVFNLFFLLVTHLRRVEGFQEVLVFMRNISIGYILMALCLIAVAPQSVTTGTATIRIPFGLLEYFDSNFLNVIGSAGCGFYLYTLICFCILFFYRYNVTCKTSTLSTIFSRKNILIFLIAVGIFCFIQSVLIYYSAVDATYLREKLNRSKESGGEGLSNILGIQGQTSSVAGNNANGAAATTSAAEKLSNNNNPPQSSHISASDESSIASASNTPAARISNIGSIVSPNGNGGAQAAYFVDASKKTVFGSDYQKNPMIFLSLGIYGATVILACVGIIVISIVVYCKLHEAENYGKESMSGKSKDEQIMLTKILMFTAYVPIILVTILAANYIVCVVRQKSMPFQEVLLGYIAPWIAITFPIFTIILVPALRVTAFQVLTCRAWISNENTGDSDLNGNTVSNSRMGVRDGEVDGKLSDDQLRALKDMTKNTQTN